MARLAGIPASVVLRADALLDQLRREQGPRQKWAIKHHARPMDGQLDLFAASQTMKESQAILDTLRGLDVSQMTPLDALNVIDDLHKKALQTRGGERP